MEDKNVVRPDLEDDSSLYLLQSYQMHNLSVYNNLSPREPHDGLLDKNTEIRLRLAMIDNYEIKREQNKFDPLDIKEVINLNTGQIALRWLDGPGGIMRPSDLGGEWKYDKSNDFENPEERSFNNWQIQSRREMVSLTHPFIWSNNDNHCGFNYIPPVGSIVIVGFRKLGFPIILGYINQNYKSMNPILKPGELSLKGYGNNYIHNRQSDKIDIKAWSIKDQIDIEDRNKSKKNTTNCTLWIRLNANLRKITLSAFENNASSEHGTHYSSIELTPKEIQITSCERNDDESNHHSQLKNTKFLQNEEMIKINTSSKSGESEIIQTFEEITINTPIFNLNTNKININNEDSFNINTGSTKMNSRLINIDGKSLNMNSESTKLNLGDTNINSSLFNINAQSSNYIVNGNLTVQSNGVRIIQGSKIYFN